MANDTLKKCLFCGKTENKVRNLFSAGNNHICDECVLFCYDILVDQGAVPPRAKAGADKFSKKPNGAVGSEGITLKKPSEIKAVLDEYVIGQDEAKIALSVAVYNHYKRLQQPVDEDGVEIEKSNIIMDAFYSWELLHRYFIINH